MNTGWAGTTWLCQLDMPRCCGTAAFLQRGHVWQMSIRPPGPPGEDLPWLKDALGPSHSPLAGAELLQARKTEQDAHVGPKSHNAPCPPRPPGARTGLSYIQDQH